MKKINDLLITAKLAVKESLLLLSKDVRRKKNYKFDRVIRKEFKSEIDNKIETKIIRLLKDTRIDILSEEIGLIKKRKKNNNLLWIIDPIDGTANYVRNLGESSVSIALFDGKTPIFGVIGTHPEGKIYWGGKKIGSFCDETKIKASFIRKKKNAILCTGFPSRFTTKNHNLDKILKEYMKYAKVRMFGSASISIIKIAEGKAEAYFENDIMIWDVAAASAILLGAGGKVIFKKGNFINSFNVFASNQRLER